MADYHRILGVSRDASNDDIKAAFRRQALKFHPDRHANASKSEQKRASDNFRQVKEAYEALSDDKNRMKRAGSGSQYSSTSGSTWSNSSYASSRAGRTGYDGRAYRQWYEERGSSTGENFRAQWTYRTTESFYGGDGRYYQRTVRWDWPPPHQGPRMILRAAFFGLAAITLMVVNSLLKPQNAEFRKSYSEMYERLQQEKRARESRQPDEAQPKDWTSSWEDLERNKD